MSEQPEASVTEKMRNDLLWRGPSGRPLGHIVLERAEAEVLLQEMRRQVEREAAKDAEIERQRVRIDDQNADYKTLSNDNEKCLRTIIELRAEVQALEAAPQRPPPPRPLSSVPFRKV